MNSFSERTWIVDSQFDVCGSTETVHRSVQREVYDWTANVMNVKLQRALSLTCTIDSPNSHNGTSGPCVYETLPIQNAIANHAAAYMCAADHFISPSDTSQHGSPIHRRKQSHRQRLNVRLSVSLITRVIFFSMLHIFIFIFTMKCRDWRCKYPYG